jgi:hypothetical protein
MECGVNCSSKIDCQVRNYRSHSRPYNTYELPPGVSRILPAFEVSAAHAMLRVFCYFAFRRAFTEATARARNNLLSSCHAIKKHDQQLTGHL